MKNCVNVKYGDQPFNPFWEKGYQDLTVSSMGGPSFEVAEMAPLLTPKSKVLDLGCGEGRNSLYLASIGCDVTAIDRSEAGIRKLETIAKKCGVTLKTQIADISNYTLEEKYDCVMAHHSLNYLDKSAWKKLLSQVKHHTTAGGINIFTLYLYNDEYPCTNEVQAAHYKNSFLPNEIRNFYDDWREIRFDQYVKWDSHPGIPMHYHPIEKLVAQKPGGKYDCHIFKEPILSKALMTNNLFHGISMGMTQQDLIEWVGAPDIINTKKAHGKQFGISLHDREYSSQATVEDYIIELWYYGNRVIYLNNGIVSGKALYNTHPMRIKITNTLTKIVKS